MHQRRGHRGTSSARILCALRGEVKPRRDAVDSGGAANEAMKLLGEIGGIGIDKRPLMCDNNGVACGYATAADIGRVPVIIAVSKRDIVTINAPAVAERRQRRLTCRLLDNGKLRGVPLADNLRAPSARSRNMLAQSAGRPFFVPSVLTRHHRVWR